MVPVPLFGAIPGGAELLVIFLVGIVSLLIALGAAYWVYRDASRRGNDDAEIWAIAVVLGAIVGNLVGLLLLLVLYLLVGRD